MSPDQQPRWKQLFWRNTLSNYVRTITRMLLGLVLFRLLYSNLDTEDFGYWSLLWSLFGYGVLLDFGFGFTAQKAVAEKTAVNDVPGLSRLLATIFWTFTGLAVVLMLLFLGIQNAFLSSVSVPEHKWESFHLVYYIFFGGMALVFPLGLFPEVLRGLQRLDIANWINTGTTIINFVGIALGLYYKASLSVIVLISVVTTLAPNLLAAFFALRMIPGLSLSPRQFQVRAVKSQMGFSVAAYLITFSNLLMAKSDQLVLSLTIGVASVTIYQAGYKMAEMLNLFTIQLQDALSPAAAGLHATGDRKGLEDLLKQTSRLTFLISTPLYLLSAVYLNPLIKILTGLESVPHETWLVGQALLLAIYSSQLSNSCSKRILMMCGYEKKLLAISVVDALLNVGISIVLAFQIGVLGVALGTLIPTALIGWLWVIPLTLGYLKLSPWSYLKVHLEGTLMPLGVFCLLLLTIVFFFPADQSTGIPGLIWRGLVPGIPGLALSWKLLKSMRL